jgi:hypothetical protein
MISLSQVHNFDQFVQTHVCRQHTSHEALGISVRAWSLLTVSVASHSTASRFSRLTCDLEAEDDETSDAALAAASRSQVCLSASPNDDNFCLMHACFDVCCAHWATEAGSKSATADKTPAKPQAKCEDKTREKAQDKAQDQVHQSHQAGDAAKKGGGGGAVLTQAEQAAREEIYRSRFDGKKVRGAPQVVYALSCVWTAYVLPVAFRVCASVLRGRLWR